jgi:hypothetical protein
VHRGIWGRNLRRSVPLLVLLRASWDTYGDFVPLLMRLRSYTLVTGQDLGGGPNLGHDTGSWGLRDSWGSYSGASGLGLVCTGVDVMGI